MKMFKIGGLGLVVGISLAGCSSGSTTSPTNTHAPVTTGVPASTGTPASSPSTSHARSSDVTVTTCTVDPSDPKTADLTISYLNSDSQPASYLFNVIFSQNGKKIGGVDNDGAAGIEPGAAGQQSTSEKDPITPSGSAPITCKLTGVTPY